MSRLRQLAHSNNETNYRHLLLARQGGFTLIELLVVIVIIGILLAIAIPSYLGFRKQAQDTAGKANVREAVPSAEAYYASRGTYTGLDRTALLAIDAGLSSKVQVAPYNSGANYCLDAPGTTSVTWYFAGPGGTVTSVSPNVACP